MPRIFLTAEWRYLTMLNYEIDPAVLQPLVPPGTELDYFQGSCMASMVGFRFLDTRILGCRIPGHTNFDEVNLRFYVRRMSSEGWRRGVVFVKEIVPLWPIAAVARTLYNEKYVCMPMRSKVSANDTRFEWRLTGEWQSLRAASLGPAEPLAEGSEEQFITEHYWGYSSQRSDGTVEYEVAHPSWRVQRAQQFELACDIEKLYGRDFTAALSRKPASGFVAEGSKVSVSSGVRL